MKQRRHKLSKRLLGDELLLHAVAGVREAIELAVRERRVARPAGIADGLEAVELELAELVVHHVGDDGHELEGNLAHARRHGLNGGELAGVTVEIRVIRDGRVARRGLDVAEDGRVIDLLLPRRLRVRLHEHALGGEALGHLLARRHQGPVGAEVTLRLTRIRIRDARQFDDLRPNGGRRRRGLHHARGERRRRCSGRQALLGVHLKPLGLCEAIHLADEQRSGREGREPQPRQHRVGFSLRFRFSVFAGASSGRPWRSSAGLGLGVGFGVGFGLRLRRRLRL
mmetsp:Transcript_1528/g.4158  ORF Transcript_1528/g.4158 Transcript_1528/m.4158 type:complete len:283 (-) Transcript_1528:6-854(-)